MNWRTIVLGVLALPVILCLLAIACVEMERCLKVHRRLPAGNILPVLAGKLERGQRISFRRIFATRRWRDRSWALVLIKEGPKEPIGDLSATVTEPLDDE